MVEIKTHRDHPRSMEDRIRNRLKPSSEPQRSPRAPQVTLGSGHALVSQSLLNRLARR
jgi:hypothetical protein